MRLLKEGESSIQPLEFVLRGKVVDCYNYDYSYSHYTKATGELASNFKLGSFVTLYNMSGVAISGSVQIIDKWSFANPDGSTNTRFRFSQEPNLEYVEGVPTVKKFYMRNATSQDWTMVTYNYEEFSGTVASVAEVTPTGISNVGGFVAINYNPAEPADPIFRSSGTAIQGGRTMFAFENSR
jgi:hypothetical protein